MRLSPSFLERSPEETTRLLCLGLLEEADRALARRERGEDGEALHDFRVALRRLRSVASAYRPYLKGSMKKKLRARLKELASSTNASRDAEVQLEWLVQEAPRLEPEARASADRLRERLEEEMRMPGAKSLRDAFDPLRAALEKSLARVRLRLGEDRATFLSATGRLLAAQGEATRESLAAVKSAEDGEELHRARIEAKRLRYLLEPLQDDVAGVRSLVKRMKSLQDVLGELQDTRVLTAAISQELDRSAIEAAHQLRDLALRDAEPGEAPRMPAADPGLLALLRVQGERRDRRYTQLERSWLSLASAPFFEDVADLAARLESAEREPSGRRRFLLSSIPEEAPRGAPRSILWGYLPGKRVRERIEAVRSGRRVSYRRILDVQGGPSIEEKLTHATFQKLWPLTCEKRLERTRYLVRDGGRQWSIESFPGRDLILAEAELDAGAGLPSWLAPLVVREVTGMKKYEPEALARSEVKHEARSAPETHAGLQAEAR
jgi:CHAD domain-containing protein